MGLNIELCKKLILKESGFALIAQNSVTIMPGDAMQVDIHFASGKIGHSIMTVSDRLEFKFTATDKEVEALKAHYKAHGNYGVES